MPIYEYRCLDCQKRSTILQLSVTNPRPASCSHCKSVRMERLLSRFASPKSEEARLESLAAPDALAGLDENDPESVSRLMKNMGNEMGEDFGGDMEGLMGASEPDSSDLDSSDAL